MKTRTRRARKVRDRGEALTRIDPTRTATARAQFAREVRRMFARVRLEVHDLVDVQDAFGLRGTKANPFALNMAPDQPRDELGRWSSKGANTYIASATEMDWKGDIKPGGKSVAVPGRVDSRFTDREIPLSVWDAAPSRVLDIKDLVWGQKSVRKEAIKGSSDIDSEIRVIKDGDNYIIYDGSHRVMKAGFSGRTTIRARVVDVSFIANSFCPTGPGGGVDPTCSPGVKIRIDPEAEAIVRRLGTTPEAIATVAGALPGARVTLVGRGSQGLIDVEIYHPDYYAERRLKLSDGGAPESVKNEVLQVKEGMRGRGLGTRIFAQQVESARAMGFKTIDTYAMGRKGAEENGYSTWAKLGYDAPLADNHLRSLPPDLSGATSVSDLMKTKSGRDWWVERGSSFNGTFDLHPDSLSSRVLREYVAEKGRRITANDAGTDLDADDDAILDKIWDDVGRDPTGNTRWTFESTPEKVRAFVSWLRTVIRRHLTDAQVLRLWDAYIRSGFRKGAGRSFEDVKRRRTDLKDQSDFYRGTKEQFLQSAFAQPVAREKVELVVGRVYSDLDGVTEAMATVMSRTLADGLVQGLSPREVARNLSRDVQGIGEARALTIARTELIRAHAEGQLTALEDLGVEEVGVAVEWAVTRRLDGTPDRKVCQKCRPLDGVVLKVAEARNMIPRHPNCRCAWVPANVGEDDENQKRSRDRIQRAVKKSQGKGNDGWEPGQRISKERPESILNSDLVQFSRLMANYDPNQPRDDHGRFGSKGGASSTPGGDVWELRDLVDPLPGPTPTGKTPRPPSSKVVLPGAPIGTRIERYKDGDRIARVMTKSYERVLGLEAKSDKIRDVLNANLDNYMAMDVRLNNLNFKVEKGDVLTKEQRTERRRLEKDIKVAADAMPKLRQKYNDARAEFLEARSKSKVEFDELMKSPHPFTVQRSDDLALPGAPGGVDQRIRDTAQAGHEWLFPKVLGGPIEAQDTNAGLVYVMNHANLDTGRAYAGTNNGTGRTIVLSKIDGPDTAVHEFGHILEHKLKVHATVKEFLEHRTRGEPLTVLKDKFKGSGYTASEVGRKDSFDRSMTEHEAYYTGKHYGKTYGGKPDTRGAYDTEVLSMGLQKLYEDPGKFFAKDPEYAKFCVGILTGALR